MNQKTIALMTMIATLLSAIGALVAAYAAMEATISWKEESQFQYRSEAVNKWVGGAAVFRGRLKFVYKQHVKWPDDKKEIEYISEHFWNWVATWPNVKANLSGKVKVEAESLWQNVFIEYSSFMEGRGSLEELGKAVQAVYNSDILMKTIENNG